MHRARFKIVPHSIDRSKNVTTHNAARQVGRGFNTQSYEARNNFLNTFKNKALNKKLKRIKFIPLIISHKICTLENFVENKNQILIENDKENEFHSFQFFI